MELDDLKTSLNQKLETEHLYLSENDIAAMLTKKANSALGKIRKSLWFEIYSCIVFLIGFGYIAISSRYTSMNIYFGSFTLLCIPFTVLLAYLLKKTDNVAEGTQSIKDNLQSIITILDEFIKRYFQFTMALIPICFVFAFYLGVNEKEAIPELDNLIDKKSLSKNVVIAILVVYLFGSGLGMYYFTKWYLKKLYGNYVAELKVYINELKNGE